MSVLFVNCLKTVSKVTTRAALVLRVQPHRRLPSWGPPRVVVDRKDIEFRVFTAIARHDKIDSKTLTADKHLMQDMGLDSLDLIECAIELEDEFKVELTAADSERLLSVTAITDHLMAIFESSVDQNQRPDIEFGPNMAKGRPVG